jgi:hypothetical protein
MTPDDRPLEGQFAFVYRHRKTGEIRVLNCEQARIMDRAKGDWVHTATLNLHVWVQHLLNLPARKRPHSIRTIIENL